jgi:hypothetical protein
MDHIVFLDSGARELENLVNGNKSMIIRGAAGRKVPHGKVREGDVLYFIRDRGESRVKAKGVVSSVLNTENLSVEESFETIIKNQDKLQLPDKQFEKIAGKSFLVLIGIDNIKEINPFRIDKSGVSDFGDWLSVGKIETIIFPRNIDV